jgi:hypothetical protein
MHILRTTCRLLRQSLAEGFGMTTRSLLIRLQVRWNEWRFGIQTDGVIQLSEFGIQNEAYKGYWPTGYHTFPRHDAKAGYRSA